MCVHARVSVCVLIYACTYTASVVYAHIIIPWGVLAGVCVYLDACMDTSVHISMAFGVRVCVNACIRAYMDVYVDISSTRGVCVKKLRKS